MINRAQYTQFCSYLHILNNVLICCYNYIFAYVIVDCVSKTIFTESVAVRIMIDGVTSFRKFKPVTQSQHRSYFVCVE
jgi:hypothetical protein